MFGLPSLGHPNDLHSRQINLNDSCAHFCKHGMTVQVGDNPEAADRPKATAGGCGGGVLMEEH